MVYLRKLRKWMQSRSITGNIDSESTYTTKHGTVATMDTTNIGRLMQAPRSLRKYRAGRDLLNLEAEYLRPVSNRDCDNL